ncbi:long-chain fatty acid--CoA ligase, partial [bacterium]|nr:long-chain fatty acid--CoA ligase [bacterium]
VDYSLEDEGKKISKDDLWTLIYTSGTTGNPKGVMLSQFNIASNVQATQDAVHFHENKTFHSFLPLSHSLERMGSHATFWLGSTTWFAESVPQVPENMKMAKPHYLISVPRLYEKIFAKVQDGVANASPLKQKIVAWSMAVGSEVSTKYLQKAKQPSGILGLKYAIAKKLVFDKLYAVFGGNFIFGISGGAPLPQAIGEFFASSGILLLEGFGLTETTPVTNVVPIDNIKFGAVGPNIADVETKIADDGEILFRGPNIMMGYFNNPEATKEAIDEDGWFSTGDIGEIDENGFLKITDRKKNIIVTSGGKNIAPANIENKLITSRYVDQIVVIGDRRNFLTAAIVPTVLAVEGWAKDQGLHYADLEDLLKKKEIYELIEKDLLPRQEELARFEQIKKFLLLAEPFTIENGALTPSMKIKRKVVETKYKAEFDALYDN